MRKRKLFVVTLFAVFLFTIIFAENEDSAPVKAVQLNGTPVSGIISENTTWTVENSPYNLTGNVLVNYGVTLTIEPGVTVNLDNYYIMVNGTLSAKGTNAEPISINGGQVIFTEYSNGWNNITKTGCIIENAIVTSSISSAVPLKISSVYANAFMISVTASVIISNSSIIGNGRISGGDYSIIERSSIIGDIKLGNAAIVVDNNITGDIAVSNFAVMVNNKINGRITSGSILITNNSITGTITIRDTLSAGSIISYNTLRGGGAVWYYGLSPIPRYPIFPISVIDVGGGPVEIANNTIISQKLTTLPPSNFDGGYGITVQANSYAHIYNNVISGGFVRGINVIGPAIIEENSIVNNTGGIAVGKNVYDYGMAVAKGDIIIRNNNLSNSLVGIGGRVINSYYGVVDYNFVLSPYNVIIEDNLIASSTIGIEIESLAIATIKNNTIYSHYVDILLANSLSATISYNNIQSHGQYSIKLQETSNNINATYNWWGTTNLSLIDQKIYDFYDDFLLGKVNYLPILESPNPYAPILPLLLVDFSYSPAAPYSGIPIIFNASQSFSERGSIANYVWDFGDGNVTAISIPIVSHIYHTHGEYSITLTIIDEFGFLNSTKKSIIVLEDDMTPLVTGHSRFPEDNVEPDQPVKITVNVTDNLSGVKEVILSYRVSGESVWHNVTMTLNQTTLLYEATIQIPQPNVNVEYKIIAYDNAGNLMVEDNNGSYYKYYVVSEFPSTIILSLFLVLIAFATIMAKRRLPKTAKSN